MKKKNYINYIHRVSCQWSLYIQEKKRKKKDRPGGGSKDNQLIKFTAQIPELV